MSASLNQLLAPHTAHPHPASPSSYADAFAAHGMGCPREYRSLDNGYAGGFLEEIDYECWNIHSPADLTHPDIIALTQPSQSKRLALIQCEGNTYIVYDQNRDCYEFWSASDDVSWDESDTLIPLLSAHLRKKN